MKRSLNKMAADIHAANVKKGFYDDAPRNIGEILCLIHAEVSEALEAHRADKFTPDRCAEYSLEVENDEYFKETFLAHTKDTFEDEIADTIIRLLDLCGYKNIDIESHIKAKLRYNTLRGHKHGKKY